MYDLPSFALRETLHERADIVTFRGSRHADDAHVLARMVDEPKGRTSRR